MTDDVKDLLGRAFGEEPPLRLDRDAVIEQGRKRLRRKRFFEAGSVVAAVVVAAVGAATLTGLGGGAEPDRLPPAASSTNSAPQGPDLPVTTTHVPTAPSSVQGGPRSAQDLNPTRLIDLLYSTVHLKEVQAPAGQPGSPKFELAGDRYIYNADVTTSRGQGALQVVVGTSKTIGGDCSTPTQRPSTDCVVNDKGGTEVVLSHFNDGGGQRRTTAFAVMPDGLRIYAMATNRASNGTPSASTGAAPVLSDDDLCVLVTKVGDGA